MTQESVKYVREGTGGRGYDVMKAYLLIASSYVVSFLQIDRATRVTDGSLDYCDLIGGMPAIDQRWTLGAVCICVDVIFIFL